MKEQMIEPLSMATGDLAASTRELNDYLRPQLSGLAVIDLRRASPERLPADDIAQVNGWERALRLIERSPATTVALFGPRIGGLALEVGLACDFRLAPMGAQVVWHNDGAVWPSTVLFRLVRLVGSAQTIRLTVLGEPVDAAAALVNGMVDAVTDDPESELARLRAAAGLHDLRVVRNLVAEATHSSYDDALGAHLAACERYLRQRKAGAD